MYYVNLILASIMFLAGSYEGFFNTQKAGNAYNIAGVVGAIFRTFLFIALGISFIAEA